MQAIVMGGAGFLGSHIADRLKKDGITPIIFDDLSRGSLYNVNGYEFCDCLLACINEKKPEYLFHFAATNGTNNFYDNPLNVLTNNCSITAELFSVLDKSSHKPKIIYASSSEVYGNCEVPTPETNDTVLTANTRDSYASSKAIGEYYTRLYCSAWGIDYLILRIFNVYGKRDQLGHVIPDLKKKIDDAEFFLRVIGSGYETRSFCHIDDFVNILFRLVESEEWNTEYNIGNPEEVTIRCLANILVEESGKDLKVRTSVGRVGDKARRCPDISKLASVIGEYEFKKLEEGIHDLSINPNN